MTTNGSQTRLIDRAKILVSKLAQGCLQENGNGSFSVATYDTAWVAMISKTINGETQWLFPESFQFLLTTQSPEGGWNVHSSEFDGVLNTLAALLALQKHKTATGYSNSMFPDDIDFRIAGAISFLNSRLQQWDVEASEHVGFEILVPAILEMLERNGIFFKFRGRRLLSSLLDQKMTKFNPEMLYGTTQSTLVHSLEAFFDKIDFDRLSHHKIAGSMMASPASTAAYLMQCSTWDNDVEAYLRSVIASRDGNGGVPSAYPSTIFELTWVVSTFLESGFSAEDLGLESLEIVADFLQRQLAAQEGIVGFAPNLLPDADDTAKTVLCLNMLGRPASPAPMIATFQCDNHFKTYVSERTSSLSANCNVLNALLHVASPSTYSEEISKAAQFLCDSWYNGPVKDKWNLSSQYPMMLLAQALIRLLRAWGIGQLFGMPEILMRDQVPLVLTQILIRTLQTQSSDGSWAKGSLEVTAYAVLTLSSVASFPWARPILPYIEQAFKAGKEVLMQNVHKWTEADHIWIEKVSYSSAVLSQAYCIAAAISSISISHNWGEAVEETFTKIPLAAVTKFQRFFSRLPLFSNESEWKLKASLIEGYLFLPQLRRIRLEIFSRDSMVEDKYLEYIPFTWTAPNNLRGAFIPNSFLWDMMVISMLNYQVDEYMEAVVGEQLEENLEPVQAIVRHLCSETETMSSPARPSEASVTDGPLKKEMITFEEHSSNPGRRESEKVTTLKDIENVLARFTSHVLQHPRVAQSSLPAQRHLRRELETFLLAQITHAEDNMRFAQQPLAANRTTQFSTPNGTYFDWVRTTSANHTSGPYSFAFFSCLIAKPGQDCFRGIKQKYLAQDLSRHLATMCRQYNDYGSIIRDRAEKNLNSINFPEFEAEAKDPMTDDDGDIESRLKEDLYWIAEYERECLGMVVRRLEEQLGQAKTEVLKVFVDVTDLYGQIYVARDIGSRMKKD